MTPEHKLAAGRFIAVKKLPYFTALIHMLIPHRVPDGTLNTMAVTEKGVLLWDAKDIEALTPAQVATSYLHEGLHVLNMHGKRRGVRDPALWNKAADLAINSDLEAAGCDMLQKVAGKAMLLPKQFGLPPSMTAEWYYNALQEKQSKEQGKGEKPEPSKGTGSGHCGGGAGHKHDGEDEAAKQAGEGSPAKPGDKPGAESGSGQAPGRSESEISAIANAIANAIIDAKGRGTVPGGFHAWATAQIMPPKIRWQDKLNKIVRGALAETCGATHTTYNKPSRRQAGLGFGVGLPVLAALTARKPRIMVAVDTSGSMSHGNAIGIAMGEVQAILKTMNCAIEYVSCDMSVQASGTTASWKDVVANMKGGGGTSFLPVFTHIENLPAKERPSVLIYATDGEGDCPSTKPASLRDVRVIWLLCGAHASPQPWGENIYAK